MAKQYVRVKIWKGTWQNFMDKKVNMDRGLKNIGQNRRMPLTRIIHMLSTKNIFLNQDELIKISKRKKFEI